MLRAQSWRYKGDDSMHSMGLEQEHRFGAAQPASYCPGLQPSSSSADPRLASFRAWGTRSLNPAFLNLLLLITPLEHHRAGGEASCSGSCPYVVHTK